MIITGLRKENITLEINNTELSYAIMDYIREKFAYKNFDDAGCDWFTDNNGNIYIGDKSWFLVKSPKMATLVDAMNLIRYNRLMKIDD